MQCTKVTVCFSFFGLFGLNMYDSSPFFSVHAVIGGQEAVAHSRPYMVYLERKTENNSRTKLCAGFLLNEEFVLTAAHCKAESYKVSLGAHNVSNQNGVERVSVKEAFPHESYSQLTYLNNIMLLKLSSKVKFNKNVNGIALADEGDGSLPKSCLVSGWGVTENNTRGSDVLMEVNVTLYDDSGCAERNCYCSVGKTGPGKGDSGGPLVCEDGKAYGVVSFWSNPKDSDPVYVYTKIPDYRSWINSVTEHHGKLNVCAIY
uniref:trypsin n=1 Tax=Sparus aurata TaxID=8175 RepID=A0A671UD74_SPAAU